MATAIAEISSHLLAQDTKQGEVKLLTSTNTKHTARRQQGKYKKGFHIQQQRSLNQLANSDGSKKRRHCRLRKAAIDLDKEVERWTAQRTGRTA